MTPTNQHRVLYLGHGSPDLYAMIRAAVLPGFELITLETNDEALRLEKLADADAVIVAASKFTRERIKAAKKLKFVHHQGVGYHDTIDLAALAEIGVPLAITPGGTATGVSEHAMMMMLAVTRRLAFMDWELRQGRWHVNSHRHVTYQLAGKTIGIIGFGRIGTAVADKLKPFGVKVIYHDILDFPPERDRAHDATRRPFEALLAESDIITIHIPLTAKNRHFIGAKELARMKPTAFLVNTARGGIVDERALAEALERGTILGAAMDVFELEPAPKDHPLYRFPNVVLTPHIAAGTRDAFETKMAHVFKNLDAFFNGRPVEDLVDYKADLAAAR